MYAATEKWFAEAQPQKDPDFQQSFKGHGRIVTYRLWATAALNDYFQTELNWPWAGQVVRIERHCWYPKTDQQQQEVHYAITDLLAHQAHPSKLFAYWHGHWRVENQGHWVLDVVFGEDASTARKGGLAKTFSLLRSGVLTLLRLGGMPNITAARSQFAAQVQLACSFVGIP